jgi:hypothetical protein
VKFTLLTKEFDLKPVVKFRQNEDFFSVATRAQRLLSVVDAIKAIEMIDRVSRATSMDEAWRIMGEYVTLVVTN